MLQLVVYAGMQVPVGVLLDRFGSRAMLLGGLVLMTDGPAGLRLRDVVPAGAVLARAVLGAGDAMVFVSVIRLVAVVVPGPAGAAGDPADRAVGQLGAIVAAAPLACALDALGWTRAFALASSLGVVLMVAVPGRSRTRRTRATTGRPDQAARPGPVGAAPSGATPAPGWGCGPTSPRSSR